MDMQMPLSEIATEEPVSVSDMLTSDPSLIAEIVGIQPYRSELDDEGGDSAELTNMFGSMQKAWERLVSNHSQSPLTSSKTDESGPRVMLSPESFESRVGEFPRRIEASQVRSVALAPLFSHLLSRAGTYRAGHRLLEDRLIDLTVRTARQDTNYYGRIVDEEGGPWSYDNLDQIPTISREEIVKQRESLISHATQFGFASFTSGSSGQAPLLVERSREEQCYLQNFFALLQLPLFEGAPPAPLRLVSMCPYHGPVFQLPRFGYSFYLDLERDYGYSIAADLLGRKFDLPGFQDHISCISGQFWTIHSLALYLEQEGLTPGDGQIIAVSTYGMQVFPSRKKKIEEVFGCPADDRYSLTEVFGGARFCHDCGAYHFDPFVVPEVIDLRSGGRIEDGTGELVLTPLFPFCQRFRLLRYRTDDLVRCWATPECPKGNKGYVFRGRLVSAAHLADDKVVCLAEVAKGLDTFPEVSRQSSSLTVVDNLTSTEPRFDVLVRERGQGIQIRVEIKDDEIAIGNAANSLRERLRDSVASGLPVDVREWLVSDPSRLVIDTVRRGVLGPGDWGP